jgi:hypothetical protein
MASMLMPGMGMADPSNKTARELFVGNTPPTTAEVVLLEFLNAAMKQVFPHALQSDEGAPV